MMHIEWSHFYALDMGGNSNSKMLRDQLNSKIMSHFRNHPQQQGLGAHAPLPMGRLDEKARIKPPPPLLDKSDIHIEAASR